MIVLSNVCKTFDSAQGRVVAVDDVSLAIEAGQIYGIIGYSGAGKSTLIRLLNGLETPTSGRIDVGGFDIARAKGSHLRQARLKISMVFQHFNLLWSRTVSQNIAFSMQIAGVPKAQIAPRVAELIALVGLQGRENAYPSQLSGGQKQRVGIARALANNPSVLLCDEATSALDPQTTHVQPRHQAEVLEDHAAARAPLAHLAAGKLGDILRHAIVFEVQHLAAAGRNGAVEGMQQRGLACAGAADHRHELAGVQIEIDVIQHALLRFIGLAESLYR